MTNRLLVLDGQRLAGTLVVAGLDYDVSGKIVACERSEDAFSFTFVSDKKSAKIVFEGERTPSGCRFTHTESFGLMKPVIGPVVNFLIFKVFYRKKANWQLIRDDMVLDNDYLYDILTEGKYPDRIPVEELKKERQ